MDALKTIYLSILSGHISANGLPQSVQKSAEKLVEAALSMNQKVNIVVSKLSGFMSPFPCFFFYFFCRQSTQIAFKKSCFYFLSISGHFNVLAHGGQISLCFQPSRLVQHLPGLFSFFVIFAILVLVLCFIQPPLTQ